MLIDATFFFFFFWPVAALPLRDFSMKVFQLLGLWGPWWHNVCRDLDCIRPGSYGPISLFLSLLEPANRRPVWPAFLWSSAHSGPQRAPLPGVLLCFSEHQPHRGGPGLGSYSRSASQALKETPWVGSYPVVQGVRRLMGQPLYCSAANAVSVAGERLW